MTRSPIEIMNFMGEAIYESRHGMEGNWGGPFGAVIVRGKVIIGRGFNQVTSTCDPTAHAEMVAIRDACRHLNTFNLAGCELYTSCEPCPMCLAAIYWARIDKVYYGNTRQDAAEIGFSDEMIYEELAKPIDQRRISMEQVLPFSANGVFKTWQAKDDKTPY